MPFPVLDDEVEEQAPIFGVRAGLRAAQHERCLVLPVDVPLITEEALRLLARERAVPQTGPLPGAYERRLLPEIEARIGRGDLTLRGLNPLVVELDEELLENVNSREDLARLPVSARSGVE